MVALGVQGGAVGAGAVGAGAVRARGAGVPRGPSTRVAPSVLAAGIARDRAVRVAVVRVEGSRARVDVLTRTGPWEVRRVIAAAQADPAVVAVEVDHRVRASDVAPAVTAPAAPTSAPAPGGPVPTAASTATVTATPVADPYRTRQWALTALHAEDVRRVAAGAGQVVGVVDSGVDATHPDLAGQVLPGTDEVTPGGDGRADAAGHGTHVAGIVAALAGNGIGVEGFAPQARILPVRALDAAGGGWDSDIAAGVIWAVDHGAGVVNLSLGGTDSSDAMRSAVLYAVARGTVVVAAVGNERQEGNPVEYPAGLSTSVPGVIAVAATTSAGVSAGYSNTGADVTLAAPGDGILSTYPGGTYALMSGTSMATPYVSAVAAVIRSAEPGLSPAQVVQVLVASAVDLEARGRDDATGAGLVDPSAALCRLGHCPAAATPSPSPSPSPSSSTGGPSPSPSAPAALRVTVAGPAPEAVAGRPATLTVTVSDGAGPVVGA